MRRALRARGVMHTSRFRRDPRPCVTQRAAAIRASHCSVSASQSMTGPSSGRCRGRVLALAPIRSRGLHQGQEYPVDDLGQSAVSDSCLVHDQVVAQQVNR